MYNLSNSDLANSGATGLNFYRANAFVKVVTSTSTFVVTVNNWAALDKSFKEFDSNSKAFDDKFIGIARDYQEANGVNDAAATTYALNKLFGDAVDIYKAPAGSTTFAVVGIDQDGKLIVIPCLNN